MRFIFQNEWPDQTQALPQTYDVAFYGQSIDERGRRSVSLTKSAAAICHATAYQPNDFALIVGSESLRADTQTFCQRFPASSVLLDATTLDVPELLLLCKHYFANPATRHIGIIYIEPGAYKLRNSADLHEFSLSAAYSPFHPIPGFTPELSSTRRGVLLAFLGFEPSRLHRVLSAEEGSNIKAFSVAFGVPPYKASWEMHALIQNADVLNEGNAAEDVHYVGANNPLAAYCLIEQQSRAVNTQTERLVLAPLGTKPASLGVVLFAASRTNVRVMFDFPTRTPDRTEGIGRIHHFGINPR